MFLKPFLAKTFFCLREKEVSVFKFCSILGLVLATSAAHSEAQAPWFGSEAAAAEQVAAETLPLKTLNFVVNRDCAIYSCSALVNIAMPLENSAANP
jgi:hypothetical protein